MSDWKSVPFKKIISESEYSSIQKKQDEVEQNYWNDWMEQINGGIRLTQPPTTCCGCRDCGNHLVFDGPLRDLWLRPAPSVYRKVYLATWMSAD